MFLETPRLILRQLTLNDVDDLVTLKCSQLHY